jgi:uncharacterized protein (TIGR02996 family)
VSSIAERLRTLVVNSPRDPGVRGVYADALIQDGDPRGTFITLQSHLERSMPPDRRESTRRQVADLLREHQERWMQPASGWAEVRFRGGFMHAIRCKGADFAARGAALLAVEPVLDVTLTDADDDDLVAIAKMPAIAHLEAITVKGGFGDPGAASLARSPHAGALAVLNLNGMELGSGFAGAAGGLHGLVSLVASGMAMGDEVAAQLARAELPKLEKLYLARNELSDEGAAALAKARLTASVRVLCLGGNEISDEGAEAIAKGKSLGNVAWLELNQTGVGDEGAIAIAKSRALKALQRLNLEQTEVGDEGLEALGKRRGLRVVR